MAEKTMEAVQLCKQMQMPLLGSGVFPITDTTLCAQAVDISLANRGPDTRQLATAMNVQWKLPWSRKDQSLFLLCLFPIASGLSAGKGIKDTSFDGEGTKIFPSASPEKFDGPNL